MPTAWYKRVQRSGKLTVFNKAGAWSHEADTALATFNLQGFPVTLEKTDDEKNANIVVKLSKGADSQTNWGKTATTPSGFDPAILHGATVPITEIHEKPRKTFEIVFAAIFLPGRVEATKKQREVIIVHEFIHACGLDGGQPDGTKDKVGQDHDDRGIFFGQMAKEGDGLIEYLHDKDAAAMPPIRVGGNTRTKIKSIWPTDDSKKN